MTPELCPNCGVDVPPGARVCPGCGSDEDTGWSDDAAYDGVGLPEEFDYDQFVEREFGKKGPVPEGISRFWWVVTVVLLIAVIMYLTL